MSMTILTCNKCDSINAKTLNPELKETATTIVVKLTAECLDCGHKFTYDSATDYGHRIGVLY